MFALCRFLFASAQQRDRPQACSSQGKRRWLRNSSTTTDLACARQNIRERSRVGKGVLVAIGFRVPVNIEAFPALEGALQIAAPDIRIRTEQRRNRQPPGNLTFKVDFEVAHIGAKTCRRSRSAAARMARGVRTRRCPAIAVIVVVRKEVAGRCGAVPDQLIDRIWTDVRQVKRLDDPVVVGLIAGQRDAQIGPRLGADVLEEKRGRVVSGAAVGGISKSSALCAVHCCAIGVISADDITHNRICA